MSQRLVRLTSVFLVASCVTTATILRHVKGANADFQISTTAFSPGESMPKKFTRDGQNVSPALAWTGSPAETQSFALIMDDPDAPAGTWVHWVLYDLPANAHELAENILTREQLSDGARQGRNDFHKIGYGGPCPPSGKPHRYFFKLYALDAKLNLKSGAIKTDVEHAMQTHIVGQAQLIGFYRR